MKSAYIPIFSLICFVTFFLITLQFRTINQSQSEINRLKTENELRDEINEWKDMYETIKYKNQELETKIAEYKSSASESNATVQLLNNEIDDLETMAGLTEVKAAEESIAKGNYVTLSELHEFLDV